MGPPFTTDKTLRTLGLFKSFLTPFLLGFCLKLVAFNPKVLLFFLIDFNFLIFIAFNFVQIILSCIIYFLCFIFGLNVQRTER